MTAEPFRRPRAAPGSGPALVAAPATSPVGVLVALLFVAFLSSLPAAAAPAAPASPATVQEAARVGSAEDVQAIAQGRSLLGRELLSQAPTPEQAAAITTAREALAAAPDDAERYVELGRALAAVWRYREAIEVYDRGLERHPRHAALLRHRGHRHVSLRDFTRAEDDLERAAELLPAATDGDGAALRFDVWYHLGLARYLQGDFAGAAEAYRRCREGIAADDHESLVAVTHWLYMSLRRDGREAEARAALEGTDAEMAVEENRSYFDLLRLYRGEVAVDAIYDPAAATPLDLATTGYGVANWWLYEGDGERAAALFRDIVESPYWPAFGFVAAEAELARDASGERP